MQTEISKWGNSQGVRIPRTLLEEAQLGVGETVLMTVQDGRIIIEPMCQVRGRYRLEDLVAQIPDDHHAAEVEWGPAVGKEEW